MQYYDERGILIPSELSEGGRRLYSEDDYKKLKIICFLRDAGISIKSIGELLSESNPSSVISVLLEKQEQALKHLSERNRENLLMYYFLEMSDTEIAKRQNISRSGVFQNRHNSLELMKKILKEK